MEAREERGLAIAATTKIKKAKGVFLVPSQSHAGTIYSVNLTGDFPTCSCPDFATRNDRCKHIYAVEFTRRRETRKDGTTITTETMRVTYQQDWPMYNLSQTVEQTRFAELLHDLCEGIMNPLQQGPGRPKLPMGDVTFALVAKVYSTMSGRRFASELEAAKAKDLIEVAPAYNTAFRYLENPELTPLLKALISETASPLTAVETDFAVDSTGFTTSTYARWFDHKWGRERKEQQWVKAHLMCGVRTHIVTSAEVHPTETADAPQLASLLAVTAKSFPIREVAGDKAYSSHRNLRAIQAVGGVPYIPFKERSTGVGKDYDALWHRLWAYYQFNRTAFLQHYHKRSNIESTNSMLKRKFGSAVRSKAPVAQVNEVLCKIICHNICVLIASIYELGLEPTFWNNEAEVDKDAEQAVAPQIGWERAY